MMSWFLLMVQLLPVLRIAVGLNFSKPNCVNQCGDVKIPYPFGIGANCYYDRSYEITCNMSSFSPKPFLQQFNLEVLNIHWPGESRSGDAMQVLTVTVPHPILCGGSSTKKIYSHDLKGSPYRFSLQYNLLTVGGCGNSAAIKQRNGETLAGCGVACGGYAFNVSEMPCNGVGCCQASIDVDSGYTIWESDVDFYEIDVILGQSTNYMSCNASIALFSDFIDIFNASTLAIIPTTLQWKATSFPLMCKDGYACVCPFPEEGNPYLPNGCQGSQDGDADYEKQ